MKKIVIPSLIVIGILVVAFVVYRVLFAKKVFLIVDVSGAVEIESGGVWIPLTPGMKVKENTRVRTSKGSKVVLALAEGVNVEVKGDSEVLLGGVKEDKVVMKLERGVVSTEIRAAGPVKKVMVTAGDNVIEASSGTVLLSSDGKGTVAVSSKGTAAKFVINKNTVEVKPGEKIVYSKGVEVLRKSKDAPLELKVKWPPTKINKKEVTISGTTEPGALITVNETVLYADDKGSFESKVTLEEGKNEIVVIASDILGRENIKRKVIEVDTSLPELRIDRKTLWR